MSAPEGHDIKPFKYLNQEKMHDKLRDHLHMALSEHCGHSGSRDLARCHSADRGFTLCNNNGISITVKLRLALGAQSFAFPLPD
jgi:hypothetical protein